jgi:hypothetical protein
MTGQRRGASFIRYELPVLIASKPTRPPTPDEQGGKGKPRPVTSMAVGEETGGSTPDTIVTTLALGEEGAESRSLSSR